MASKACILPMIPGTDTKSTEKSWVSGICVHSKYHLIDIKNFKFQEKNLTITKLLVWFSSVIKNGLFVSKRKVWCVSLHFHLLNNLILYLHMLKCTFCYNASLLKRLNITLYQSWLNQDYGHI